MTRRILAAAVFCLTAAGCAAPVGTGPGVTVPRNSAQVCREHCKALGLELGAVAIMASNVGCICQAAPPGGNASAAIAAGMATIVVQQQQEEQQRQQRQQQR